MYVCNRHWDHLFSICERNIFFKWKFSKTEKSWRFSIEFSRLACWHNWFGEFPSDEIKMRARLIKRNQIQQVSQHRKTLFFFFWWDSSDVSDISLSLSLPSFECMCKCMRWSLCPSLVCYLFCTRAFEFIKRNQLIHKHTRSTIQTSHRTVKVQPYEWVRVWDSVCAYIKLSRTNDRDEPVSVPVCRDVFVCPCEWMSVLSVFDSKAIKVKILYFRCSLHIHRHLELRRHTLSLHVCVYIRSCVSLSCSPSRTLCVCVCFFLLFPIFIVIICEYWKRQSECAK